MSEAEIQNSKLIQNLKINTEEENSSIKSLRKGFSDMDKIKNQKDELCKKIKLLETDIRAIYTEIKDLQMMVSVKEGKAFDLNKNRDNLISEIRKLDKNYGKEHEKLMKQFDDIIFEY
ncbi:hypothetical protein [Gaetbulibacter aestuarii]|uniref:Uncharacterized protein n=1 Tax=Gaetbulibacter aestuarii TaxID=1502358 RepID=A0ABW7N129_9FLAO